MSGRCFRELVWKPDKCKWASFIGRMYFMRTARLRFCLLTLAMALTLGACNRSTTHSSRNIQPYASPPAFHSPANPDVASSTDHITATPEMAANPVRLIIPAIDVNAAVEPVGVLSNGDLATAAKNPWDDVGWFESGTHPGKLGSAVIDGHLDRPGGYPAVFWHLREMRIGDVVMVVDAGGKTLRFHVIGIVFYPSQNAPVQQIFGNAGGSFLNLITCAGDWIPRQHQTTLRLVVYTSLGSGI
jgi:sortase (surface protein transpeptidase)